MEASRSSSSGTPQASLARPRALGAGADLVSVRSKLVGGGYELAEGDDALIHAWSLVAAPAGSQWPLSGSSSEEATLTLDVAGSY